MKYVVDRPPRGADLYVFNPSLITLDLEREVIARLLAEEPNARVLVVGTTASMLPEEFDGLGVTVVQGEAEQLYWRLDEVLDRPGEKVQLGVTEDLDRLPLPDWTPLGPERFRIGYDFWRFPTGLVQSSRGCRFKCNYCPYLVLENNTRFRDPRAVAEEMREGILRWGFRSFKFRDPLFGLSRDRTMQTHRRDWPPAADSRWEARAILYRKPHRAAAAGDAAAAEAGRADERHLRRGNAQ